MKRFTVVFASCLLMMILIMSLAGCSKKTNEVETFRVGMECNYAPYNWTIDEPNEYSVPIEGGGFADGYDVQIAKRIAEGLGKELVIVKTEWDGLSLSVSTGKIDAIIAGMSPTEERKQSIDFTECYYVHKNGILVRKDSKYAEGQSLDDFSGARISSQLNTYTYDLIDQIPGVEKASALESVPTLTVALSSGVIDGFVLDGPGALGVVTSNPELIYIDFENGKGFEMDISESGSAVGLKKGSELLGSINEILEKISEDDRTEIMAEAVQRQPLAQ